MHGAKEDLRRALEGVYQKNGKQAGLAGFLLGLGALIGSIVTTWLLSG